MPAAGPPAGRTAADPLSGRLPRPALCCGGAEPRRTLVVRTPADARRLLRWWPRHDAIVAALPDRDAAGNLAVQARLEELYFECGCAAGARALLAALGLGPVAAWLTWPYALANTISALSIWFLIVVAWTLSAKLITQLQARVLLRCGIKELDMKS